MATVLRSRTPAPEAEETDDGIPWGVIFSVLGVLAIFVLLFWWIPQIYHCWVARRTPGFRHTRDSAQEEDLCAEALFCFAGVVFGLVMLFVSPSWLATAFFVGWIILFSILYARITSLFLFQKDSN